MSDNEYYFEMVSVARLIHPAKRLEELMALDQGARIGESTVVSRKVHTYDPAKPEEIRVLQDADAGQVFYQRPTTNEVYHLDVFHQQGMVDHRQAAKAIKEAIAKYNAAYAIENCLMLNRSFDEVKPDMIDVQTGTGGGRITGGLNYGKKLSLRRAHENHVHVAAIIPTNHLACLFLVVMAVEAVIQSNLLEIRKNERIVHQKGGSRGPGDMSAYSDHSDSFLRDKQSLQQSSQSIQKHQYNQDAAELMNDFETLEDLAETLESTQREGNKHSLTRELEQKANGEQTVDRLSAMGIIKCDRNKTRLTKYGKEFLDYLSLNMPEVQAHFRQALRLIKPMTKSAGRQKFYTAGHQITGLRSACSLPLCGEWLGDLDTAATVLTAARRTVAEQADKFIITIADIRQNLKRRRKKVEICLVLDASASMAGQRLKASKFLVRHLLLATPDRISVIAFQEQQARVLVPLTRDYRQVEESLKGLRAYGSTPLALGLRKSLTHLKEASARNPLVVLITDGVATYSECTRDPIMDALQAAAEIKSSGYDFTCIGLKPHKNYLDQLAENAGGSKYIVDELDKQALVKAVWSEYAERC